MFELTTDQVIATARACHEVHRAYCQYLGDESQSPWHEAPDLAKDSVVTAVKARAQNPFAPASDSREGVILESVSGDQRNRDQLFCNTCMTMFSAFGFMDK